MNVEVRYSIILNYKRQSAAIPSFDIRYLQSAGGGFDILRFCGSLFKFVKFHTRCQDIALNSLTPDTPPAENL